MIHFSDFNLCISFNILIVFYFMKNKNYYMQTYNKLLYAFY